MISRSILSGIAACVVGVALTGIVIDGGRTIGAAPYAPSGKTPILSHEDSGEARDSEAEGEQEEGPLGEAHEFFGNALVLLLGGHVAYLFLFKRPLARFMLFAEAKKRPEK